MAQSKVLPSEVGLENIKFDTALMLNRLRNLQDMYKKKKISRDQLRLEKLMDDDQAIKNAEIGPRIIGYIFQAILSLSSFKYNGQLHEFIKVSNESLMIQEEHLFHNCSLEINNNFFNCCKERQDKIINPPFEVIQFFEASVLIDRLLIKKRRISNMGNKYISENTKKYTDLATWKGFLGKFDIFLARSEIVIRAPLEHQIFYLSSDQLLMIHNKIHETLNTLYLGWLLSGSTFSKDFYPHQVKLITFMVNKVIILGNGAYTLFKNFDGLATGYIMEKEKIFDNSEPLRDILNDCCSNRVLSRSEIRTIHAIFNRVAHESLELSSMSKLLGHPDIQTMRGIDKLRKRTFSHNPVDRQEINDLISSAKKNFLQSYVMKRKKWPLVILSKSCSPTLVYCVMNNIWIYDQSIPSHLPKITLRDFSEVELTKVEEFDDMLSQFDFLKDTALAEVRSVLNNKTILQVRDERLRRTLVYFLITQSPHTGVKQYMEKFRIKDPDCLEYCVIKLTQKERELKEEGRLFGQSPYEERARRCILEHNISRLMERYNQNQAMTLSELNKFQKLYALSRLTEKYDQYNTVTISVDVEAWNNNFRRIVCEPFGREIVDKLFGVSDFSHVMDVFEHGVFCISDGVFDYAWEGQLGGIEGLAQKFWTLIYESVASRVADLTGYKNFIMVNGDDLRVIILIPKAEASGDDLKELIKKIAKNFEENFLKYGFKLKIQETYFSTSLIGFGKVYVHNGSFCSVTLKKGAKLHGLANLMGDYPLEYIKGVFSEGVSTCAYSTNHRYIFFLTIIRFCMYLSTFDESFLKLNLMDKIICTILPRNFGGFPVLPYIRFLYKGDSDLETCWWSLYYFILKYNKNMGEKLFAITSSMIVKARNYHGLAMNPFSVPNDTPPEGFSIIQNFIRQQLPKLVKNREFKILLNQSSGKKKDIFIDSLFSCDPIPAKPLSVIYETSACGIIDEFISKFDSSKSIGSLVSDKFTSIRSLRILRRAKQFDLAKIRFLVNRVRDPNSYQPGRLFKFFRNYCDCPTKWSDFVRSWCYKKDIVGITYPCIADQVQIMTSVDVVDGGDLSAITYWKDPIPSDVNPNYNHGTSKIFLGNHTHLKLISPDLEIKNTSPGLRRLNKLLKIYSMMRSLGEQCETFLDRNLEDLTGIDAEILKTAVYHYSSGSISHRVPTNHWSPLVGPNELSNISSFIKTTTRTDNKLKTKGGDFTINYGLIRSHIIKTVMYEYEFNGAGYPTPRETGFARVTDCESCTRDVSDKPVTWNNQPPLLNFNLTNNTYATLNPNDIEILKNKLITFQTEKHKRVYERLNVANSTHVFLARTLVARNFLLSTQDDLKNFLLSNQLGGEFDDEDLSILHTSTTIELANLTDLKCTPCNIMWEAIMEFSISWYCSNYPEEIGNDSIENIIYTHSSELPLEKFSESVIESGYWPVFREYLIGLSEHNIPPINCSDSTTIKVYLNRLAIMEIKAVKSKPVKPMTMIHILPVSQFPSNEDLIKFTEGGLKRIFYKIVHSFFLTNKGQELWRLIEVGDLDSTIPLINPLMSVKTSIKCTSLDNPDFKIFTYSTDKDDHFLITSILLLTGLPRLTISSMMAYLMGFESSNPSNELIQEFLNITIKVEMVPLHESTSLVREIGNEEFKNYYLLKQQIQSMDISSGVQGTVLLAATKIRGNEIIAERINETAGDQILESRVSRFYPIIQEINNQLSQNKSHYRTAINRSIGTNGFHGVGLRVIMDKYVLIDSKSTGPVVVINDKTGSFSAALLEHFRTVRCMNITYNYTDITKIPSFPHLDKYKVQQGHRIDLHLSQLTIGDLFNPEQREAIFNWIEINYKAPFSIIFTNYSQHIQEKISLLEFIKLIIKFLMSRLHENGSWIIRVAHRIPTDLIKSLIMLCTLFNSVFLDNSCISHSRFVDLYIICTGLYSNPYQSIIIGDPFLKRIERILTPYTSESIRHVDWDDSNEYAELQGLIKKYGRASSDFLMKIFPSLMISLRAHSVIENIEIWYQKLCKQVHEEKTKLIRLFYSQYPSGNPRTEYRFISSSRYTGRLLIEYQVIDYLLSHYPATSSIKDYFSYVFNASTLTYQEVVALLPSDFTDHIDYQNLHDVIGINWIEDEYYKFYEHCQAFIVWHFIKFLK